MRSSSSPHRWRRRALPVSSRVLAAAIVAAASFQDESPASHARDERAPRALDGSALRARLDAAAAELAALGFEVDPSAVPIEQLSAREWKRASIDETKELVPEHTVAVRVHLANALGDWSVTSVEGMHEATAITSRAFVGARYFPRTRSIGLPGAGILESDELGVFVLAHELVHVWRDRQGELLAAYGDAGATLDARAVLGCMVEGEAQLAALALERGRAGVDLASLTDEDLAGPEPLPLLPARGLLPYGVGARFAMHAWRSGGWDAVRAAFAARPSSSEQVLHPRKLGHDEPTDVALPPWPADVAGPAELVGADVLGELEILCALLQRGVDPHEARIAAIGWDGDRVEVHRAPSGAITLVWRSIWDRAVDAEQLARALAPLGDGELRVHGRVVDWVRTVDAALAPRLLDALAPSASAPPEDAEDAASTRVEEERAVARRARPSFEADGRWHVPALDVSLPIPRGWRRDPEPFPALRASASDAHGKLTFVRLPNLGPRTIAAIARAQREASPSAFAIDAVEEKEIAGRKAVWVAGRSGGDPTCFVAWPVGFELHSLWFSAAPRHWDEAAAALDAMLSGARPGVAAAEELAESTTDAEDPLERPCRVTIDVVRDDGTPAPAGTEVWVARGDALDRFRWGMLDEGELEAQVHERGRRFVTGAGGRVTVDDARGELRAFARTPEGFGYDTIWPVPEMPADVICLRPDRVVSVRVVDADGDPVRGAPVAILAVDADGDPRLHAERTTKRDGTARWKHALAEVPAFGAPHEIHVALACALAAPAAVRIDLDAPPPDPVELVLPPTGALVLEIDDAWADELAAEGDLLVRLRVRDAARAPELRQDLELAEGARQCTFSHVGLGLALEASVGDDFDAPWIPIAGPTEAGERRVHRLERSDARASGTQRGSPRRVTRNATGEVHVLLAPPPGEPSAVPWWPVKVELAHEGGGDATSLGWASASPPGEMHCTGHDLAPGRHELRVLERASGVVLERRDVDVSARGDFPLVTIDLRDRYQPVTLRVLDHRHAPVSGTVRVHRDPLRLPVDARGIVLWRKDAPLSLDVQAPGQRTVTCDAIVGDCSIVLPPGLVVELELAADPPRVAEGYELCVALQPKPTRLDEFLGRERFPIPFDRVVARSRTITVSAPAVGWHDVVWHVRRAGAPDAEDSIHTVSIGADEPILVLEREEPQRHAVEPPSAEELERARRVLQD